MDIERIKRLGKLKNENKMFQYKPYGWQVEFHKKGLDNSERMLCAANRVGKTFSAAHEVCFHATGLYPDWWEGKRFNDPPLIWAGGVTNESLRDIIQKELLGGLGEDQGTGAIPKRLIKATTRRQCGIGDVADTTSIQHTRGTSKIVFKSYEQGWKKWQGTAPQVVWLDEEPDYKIYTECQTRILTSRGILLVTFTPLSGVTDMVQHFREGKPGTYVKNVTWDDVDHLSKEDKERLWNALPPHERDARAKGIPMQGSGRIFEIDEARITCKPFEIPEYWPQIIGIDFGWEHPAATVKLAWNREEDIFYLVASHKQEKMLEEMHVSKIKAMGEDLPVAWPHDGHKTTGRDGAQTRKVYARLGAKMLSRSARHDIDVGGSQSVERSIHNFLSRMESGRFFAFEGQDAFFEEFRNYHRKDGKINNVRDDILSAMFYAGMMIKRFGTTKRKTFVSQIPTRPLMSTRR